MPEYILVYCRHITNDADKKTHTFAYVVGSARQGAMDPLLSMFEHYAGEYSYVLFNFTLRPLLSQLKDWERMQEYMAEARWFIETCQVLWADTQQTGPGLEK